MRRAVLILALALAAPAAAQPARFTGITVEQFKRLCDNDLNTGTPSCGAYLWGVVEGAIMARAAVARDLKHNGMLYSPQEEIVNRPLYCGDEVTRRDLNAAVFRYLRIRKDVDDLPIAVAALAAISNAFPCK